MTQLKQVLHFKRYTDRNGTEKTWSTAIGIVTPAKNGHERLRIDYMPAGVNGPLELIIAPPLPKRAD